jgi:hypothetical protein
MGTDSAAGGTDNVTLVDGVPAVAGIEDLFTQIDKLAKSRPRGNPLLPPLLFHGDLADATVTGYRKRLRVGGKWTVPNVLVQSGAAVDPADDPGFFDGIAAGLKRAMPGGWRGMAGVRGLRLPLYRRARDVLDAHPSADVDADPRRDLRNQLHDRRSKLLSWKEPLDDAGEHATGNHLLRLLGLVGVVAVPLSRVLFGWRLRFGRFRWFCKNVERIDDQDLDFLDYALHLTQGGALRDDDVLIRQVLMLALLRDLHGATRFSLVSPFRRRRVMPFVLHLERVVADSAGFRLIETLIRVGSTTRQRHTIMVLASLAPAPDGDGMPLPAGTAVCSLEEAAEMLKPLVERGEKLSDDALLVDVPPGPTSEDDRRWLRRHTRVLPKPRRPILVPLATLLVGLGVAGGILMRFGVLPVPGSNARCPHLDNVGGEEIGLGDGTAECSVFDEVSDAQRPLADAMMEVERDIAAENAEVLDRGQPYGTIVFFAPLTVPDEPERQNENALNQMRGILLAQHRANELASGDQNRAFTRVLIANAGDQFAHGEDVADQIIDEARDDETIIGVAGISQSRDASFAAVRQLGEAGLLPVVGGPVTGDQMVSTTDLYFQVSPRNVRVAAMLVEFSENVEIVPVGEGELAIPDGAVITTDHSDAYSENLAEDLYRELGDGEVEIVSYPFEDSDAPLRDLPSDIPAPIRVGSLNELAGQVCNAMERGGRDVIYFTNRSSQFEGMLNAMEDNNDCPEAFTVVGGSAVTKIMENDPDLMADHPGVDLYYAAFASRDLAYNSSTERFIESYDETYGGATGGDIRVGTDVSDAALAYDAFAALQRTADYAKQNGFTISAATSAQALVDDQVEFNGVSGYIAFGNDPLGSEAGGYQQVPPAKPVLVLRARVTGSPPELACGRLSDDQNRDTWDSHPDRRLCPTVN